MKFTRVGGLTLAAALMVTAVVSASAVQPDTASYGFQAGKVGRTAQSVPYAGKNYAGGEQGDTSAYSFRAGRIGKPWNTEE